MVKLLWDSAEMRGQGVADFRPEEYEHFLARLKDVTEAPLEFRQEQEVRRAGGVCVPVRLGNSRTGWGVWSPVADGPAARAAEAAAEVVGRLFTGEQDISSLAIEVADLYEELNFLYEMSSRVGALPDEI